MQDNGGRVSPKKVLTRAAFIDIFAPILISRCYAGNERREWREISPWIAAYVYAPDAANVGEFLI